MERSLVESDTVIQHWTHGSLQEAITEALTKAGRSLDNLTHEDVAPVDEFHIGGAAATTHLAELMGLRQGMSLLDIGSGLGGPARFFARQYGCVVAGVDLTPEYVEVAKWLNQLVKQNVEFHLGSATDLPFHNYTFDAATLIHVGMSISNKSQVVSEAARVIKPGGVFAIYEVMRLAPVELDFPLPWAETPDLSFVSEPSVYREAAERSGFEIAWEENRASFAIEFFRRIRALASKSGPMPIGLHILMKETASQKVDNMVANIEQGLLAPIVMICRRR